jgi:uncharacterized protein YjbI with pentapeptide repeats
LENSEHELRSEKPFKKINSGDNRIFLSLEKIMRLEFCELQKIIELHDQFLSGSKDGKKAELANAELYGSNLVGVNLKGANLEGADLKRSLLCDSNLEGANLKGAFFKHAILEGANLKDAILTGASLRGANLERAELRGAVFLKADLVDSSVKGAVYDETTIWPKEFDPKTTGALFVSKKEAL